MHHICNFVRLTTTNQQQRHDILKSTKTFLNLRKHKNMFLNFNKKHKNVFYVYDLT